MILWETFHIQTKPLWTWISGLQNKWIKFKKLKSNIHDCVFFLNKSNADPLWGCKHQNTLADLLDKGNYKERLMWSPHLFLLSSLTFKSHIALELIWSTPSPQIPMVVLPPSRGRTRTAGHHPTWKLFLRCFSKCALCLIPIEFIPVFTSSALVSCSIRGGLIDTL